MLYGLGRLFVLVYDSYLFVDRQPYLQMQTYNSIMLKWQTPQSEIGCVEYGKTVLNKKLCEDEASKKHRLVLEDLDEDSRYLYKVHSSSLTIDNTDRYFTTLHKDANRSQYLWLIGDSGKAGPDQLQVLEQMQNFMLDKKLDLWLLLGDNAYRSGTQKQYNSALFEPYKDLIKKHVPWALNGNHDARRWAFYDIFEFPTEGQSGGIASGNEKFYSIEQGDLHILMIDSEEADLSKESELARWLEKDLQANTKKWTVAAFHHPPYTHGGHNSDTARDSGGRLFSVRENILPILEKYDVDLVYSGHSHDYERSKLMHKHYQDSTHFDKHLHIIQEHKNDYCKNLKKTPYGGTVYTVMGSSSKLDRAKLDHPAMPFSFEKMGSVILEVDKAYLKSSFIDIDGNITDSFILRKEENCL